MNVNEAVQAYQEQYPTYERFTEKLRSHVEELLGLSQIDYTIEHRTKEVDHFRDKITRAGKSYEDPLIEVTDLCGLRVILRRLSDVDSVVRLFKDEFEIDEENSVYKEHELEVDRFGYLSVHLVVRLRRDRASHIDWTRFNHLKAEVQIRTVLQHAWALISHPFDYKAKADVPREIRRRLFRLSALFELADTELEQIAQAASRLIEEYRSEVSEGNTAIELNADSLRAYMETSPSVKYWTDFLENSRNIRVRHSLAPLSTVIDTAKVCGVTSLDQIDRVLQKAKGWGEEFFTQYLPRLAQHEGYDRENISYAPVGVMNDLIIASYAERLTLDSLPEWYSNDSFILDEARAARRLGPPSPQTSS